MKKETAQKLTAKQEAFCREYLIDLNAAQAAIRAGYSEKTAKEIGSENLTKPNISTRIARLLKKREERTEVTVDRVLAEIAKVAFIQESDFYHEDGTVKLASELSDDQRSGLKSYSVKSVNIGDGQYEEIPIFTAHDKLKALEMTAKHLGMFTEKIELKGEVGVNYYAPKKNKDN